MPVQIKTSPLLRHVLISLVLSCSFNQVAGGHNKVVVIPLDGTSNTQGVITVAKRGGDFSSPIAAIESISEDEESPYLIVIAPGVYELDAQLRMENNVEIVGSGRFNTVLRGNISADTLGESAALVVGANGTSISNLTIENMGGPNRFSVGLSLYDASPLINDVIVKSNGNDINVAIAARDSLSILSKVRATSQSGSTQFGFRILESSRLRIVNSEVNLSSPDATQVGIANYSSPALQISNTTIKLEGFGSTSTGVLDGTGSSDETFSIIQASNIEAAKSVDGTTALGFTTYVNDSILNGTVSGHRSCTSSISNGGTLLDANCDEIN